MKFLFISLSIFLHLAIGHSQNYQQDYIEKWKAFYPSKSVAKGIHASILQYENRSATTVQTWLDYNKKMYAIFSDTNQSEIKANSINYRLLRLQTEKEIDLWETQRPHHYSLSLYTQLIGKAATPLLKAKYLSSFEKNQLLCQRLTSVQNLCKAAIQNLKSSSKEAIKTDINSLRKAKIYYEQTLLEKGKAIQTACPDFSNQCLQTGKAIQNLIDHIEKSLLPNAISTTKILGKTAYAKQLALYTDKAFTPERLAEMAKAEINTVRQLMEEVAVSYLKQQYPSRPLPTDNKAIIQAALADMEKDAPKNGADYLQFWQELSAAATQFIEEKEIATLPEFQTLRILPAPESAGPAARIGWVDSAPPFSPNPLTTLYLPSIPDTFPEKERIDFWSSFNKPFNRMIAIHELFPGHYMQIKISRETPHTVRLLFPYALYFEGWATFCERVLLDAGWEKERPLTFLAHLRKRLENANRAYTSVMTHYYGWDKEKVMDFSINTSLLAPQFAKSLWGRLMNGPMQMTSYFLGGSQFTELLAAEKKRLKDQFVLKDFMDTIMQAGPIPVEDFSKIFKH
jgi:uncharacterized protein (DUF885 family)